MFGLGYIGYMTFIVTLLREQRVSDRRGRSRSTPCSVSRVVGLVVALGRGCCSASAAASTLALMNALLALATLLPVLSAPTRPRCSSRACCSAPSCCRWSPRPRPWSGTTSPPPTGRPASPRFTIVFAVGQIVGPSGVGFIADCAGGLRAGLACSAALLAVGAVVAWWQKPLDR